MKHSMNTIKVCFPVLCAALLFLLLLPGCDIEESAANANESFLKVYDNNLFDGAYIPLDIQQTADGSYLILSGTKIEESNFMGITILRTDAEGNFLNEYTLEPQYVHPTYNLIKNEEGFFFFCMDGVSLQAQLVKISEADGTIARVTPVGNTQYPLYATASDNNKFILQSYNNNDKQTMLSVIESDGKVSKRQGFGIGAGVAVEQPLIAHFTRTGRQLPFLAGKTDAGLFYFNGFYNYTFSLVFTNLNSETPSGVVQGQQDNGGTSAFLPLGGNKFAASSFNFGDNYIHPGITINTQGITSAVDLPGLSMPELLPDTRVIAKRVVINGTNTLLYGSNTKNGQIILLAYDELTGALKGTHYLGFSYPYEIAGFVQTEDEGLAIAALTYVAGRFPRICLFKLSKAELGKIGG